ncbi:retrotransposon protein, putative, ty1-copia subclass, partial [Tanacetum coccineum]
WVDAMNAEMQSMKDNQVWCLVNLPPNSKGYTQTYRADYEETFSPVADIRAIRILIAIAAFYDYEIFKMDVKTTFLNGYLNEDIYMVQPEGFVDPNHLRKVCKLQRSIYGLKQASRSWNKIFDEEIKKFRLTQNLDEPCVYQKASRINVTFLILYVDDIIIMGNHISSLQSVKSYLGKCFAMKDLGEAAFILRIKINRDRLKRLIGLNPGDTTLDCCENLRRSSNAVDWKSSKQSTTAMSATKAEYLHASEAGMESVWIRKFILWLGIVPTINEPIKMFCDNSAALLIANEPGVQRGARHYHRRYHYVGECIELGEINLIKVHTDDNLANLFTKALSKGKLTQHARSMGLHLGSSFMSTCA